MIVGIFFSCTTPKPKVDLLVKNATVYTVNKSFDTAEAFVVKEGKILEVASLDTLLKKYTPLETFDAQGKTIVPGLIDAHAHFYGLGLSKQQVDLVGTKSFDEVLERLKRFQEKYNKSYITGRGWDQNDWEDKTFPTKEKLDKLFPDTPVAITRIDGHAMLVNTVALERAGILPTTIVPGGKIVVKNGKLTGVLVDRAMDLVQADIPTPTLAEKEQALLTAQEICLKNGLTTIDDAGLDDEIIELIEKLQQENKLKVRLYAMLSYSPNNLFKYLPKGPKKTDKLHVRSVKFYADGALGSRGAALIEPYHDNPGNKGLLMLKPNQFKAMAVRIKEAGFQMNTHAIGDAANSMVLKIYDSVLKDTQNARWRIEHAQVVAPEDFKYFSNNCIPSVQPTHATSDMYWAEDRLGKDRIKGAYAYKTLLKQAGVIALGTDFPIEQVNPLLTFYAAVSRKDLNGYPKEGFMKEEALTREEALKGMTLWAAYTNFEENEKGSIEPQKWADFTVLDTDIMQVAEEKIPNAKVVATFIAGKREY
jgi:hypothetical protein